MDGWSGGGGRQELVMGVNGWMNRWMDGWSGSQVRSWSEKTPFIRSQTKKFYKIK